MFILKFSDETFLPIIMILIFLVYIENILSRTFLKKLLSDNKTKWQMTTDLIST